MKRKLLIVYVLVAFVMLCTNVYAMVTADLSLVADKSTIKPGEEVIVTVELKNLSSEVSSIEGYINIDENVLESISENMIVNNNKKIEVKTKGVLTNSLTYAFNPSLDNADYAVIFNTSESATFGNDVFFIMDFDKDLVDDSQIMQLKYKVKEQTQDSDIENAVKLDCVVVYSGNNNDKSAELNAKLDIKVASVVEDGNNEQPDDTNTNTNTNTNEETNTNTNTNTNANTNENTNTNTNTNTNSNTNKNTNTNTNSNTNKNTNSNTNANTNTNKTDNTVSGTKMPAAGLRTVFVPMVIFMILAYVSYTKYISYKDV